MHGFGTDDTYHDSYNGHQAYGYGHIDPYLNHKQGRGTFHCLSFDLHSDIMQDTDTLSQAMATIQSMLQHIMLVDTILEV